MNTQRQLQTNTAAPTITTTIALNPAPLSRPTLVTVGVRDELMALRRALAARIESARAELGELTVMRHQAQADGSGSEALADATRALQQRLSEHHARVSEMKAELIGKAVARRLGQVTDCQFQMMIDGVPYYFFSDLETGVRFDCIAYGTEANRIMYQHKADLEKAVKLMTGRELIWVREALESWAKVSGNISG